MVTDDELRRIMPNLKPDRRALMLPYIQQAMQEFGITSYWREAAFLAQLAHESAELRYMEEIASGAAYEGRRDLGNTQPGDGKRFKGRGPIQLTGRANYDKYGKLLGLDLINNPTQAATPQVGFRIAGLFWKSNGLNELADKQQFITITKRINGGTNGLEDRQKYYARAQQVLSKDDAAPPAAPVDPFAGMTGGVEGSTRGIPSGGTGMTPTTGDVPLNLSRGIYPGQEGGAAKGGAKKSAAKKSAAKKSGTKKGGGASKGGAKKSAKSAKKSGAKKGASKTGGAKGGAKKGGSKKGGGGAKGSGAKGGSKKSAGGSRKSGSKKGGGSSKKSGGGKKSGGSTKGGARKGGSRGRGGR